MADASTDTTATAPAPLLQGHRTRVGQLMAGQRDIYAVRTKKGAATHHHAAVEDAATCERERHDRT
jgi:hypothetical protein